MRTIPATLLRRLAVLETSHARPLFVQVCCYEVQLLKRTYRGWWPAIAEVCERERAIEAERREAVDAALTSLRSQAIIAGHGYFSYWAYGAPSGKVRLDTNVGVVDLAVDCVPGVWVTTAEEHRELVFLFYADEEPDMFRPPAWGRIADYYKRRYGRRKVYHGNLPAQNYNQAE